MVLTIAAMLGLLLGVSVVVVGATAFLFGLDDGLSEPGPADLELSRLDRLDRLRFEPRSVRPGAERG